VNLSVRDVFKAGPGGAQLAGVSFEIESGGSVALVAPVGGGKTTLLRLLAGVVAPDRGEVRADGRALAGLDYRELQAHRVATGFGFERRALLANQPLFANVALPIHYHRPASEAEVRERVLSLLAELGIEKQAALRPGDANQSVRKRALIARALVLEPRLLLLDEPAIDLTPAEQERVRAALERRRARASMTIVQADHDGHFGPLAPERTLLLGDGKVLAEGEPEAMAKLADELERKKVSA